MFTIHCSHCVGLVVTPVLELSSLEGRKIISLKPRDEDNMLRGRGRRGGGRQQQTAVFRAASASGGRIQPTISARVEEAVPEEILEQVPEELISEYAAQREGGHFGAEATFASKSGRFLDSENDDESLAQAEHAFEEELAEEEAHHHVESEGHDTEHSHHIDDEDVKQPYSPFEAEPESIAGVFRLKAKGNELSDDDHSDDEMLTIPVINNDDLESSVDREQLTLNSHASGAWQGEQLELPVADSDDT